MRRAEGVNNRTGLDPLHLSLYELHYFNATVQVFADACNGYLRSAPVSNLMAVIHNRVYRVPPTFVVFIQEGLQAFSPFAFETSCSFNETTGIRIIDTLQLGLGELRYSRTRCSTHELAIDFLD